MIRFLSDSVIVSFPDASFFQVTTTDDPIIRRLASEDMATVFATDSILATLMCAPRSVYSWDIVVQRVGNKLFFDKRDGSQLDMLTVNETAQESLPEAKEDINSAPALSMEATVTNQNFSQQVSQLYATNGVLSQSPGLNQLNLIDTRCSLFWISSLLKLLARFRCDHRRLCEDSYFIRFVYSTPLSLTSITLF